MVIIWAIIVPLIIIWAIIAPLSNNCATHLEDANTGIHLCDYFLSSRSSQIKILRLDGKVAKLKSKEFHKKTVTDANGLDSDKIISEFVFIFWIKIQIKY